MLRGGWLESSSHPPLSGSTRDLGLESLQRGLDVDDERLDVPERAVDLRLRAVERGPDLRGRRQTLARSLNQASDAAKVDVLASLRQVPPSDPTSPAAREPECE